MSNPFDRERGQRGRCGRCGLEDPQYQGWANYPTWVVGLWLANEEGLQRHAERLARDVREAWEGSKEKEVYGLARALEEWAWGDLIPPLDGLAADLLTWAWEHVDWQEIAATYLA